MANFEAPLPAPPCARGEELITSEVNQLVHRAPATPPETCGSALAGHCVSPAPAPARTPRRGRGNRPGGRRGDTQKPAISGTPRRPCSGRAWDISGHRPRQPS